MKLIDLSPRWIHPNIFAFKCPHCQVAILTCKTIEMDIFDQIDIFVKYFGEENGMTIVPTQPECKWRLTWSTEPPSIASLIMPPEFLTMTVKPSINAEASGHWHGWITDGMIA